MGLPPSLEDGRGALRQFSCTAFAQDLLSNVLDSCSVALVTNTAQTGTEFRSAETFGVKVLMLVKSLDVCNFQATHSRRDRFIPLQIFYKLNRICLPIEGQGAEITCLSSYLSSWRTRSISVRSDSVGTRGPKPPLSWGSKFASYAP